MKIYFLWFIDELKKKDQCRKLYFNERFQSVRVEIIDSYKLKFSLTQSKGRLVGILKWINWRKKGKTFSKTRYNLCIFFFFCDLVILFFLVNEKLIWTRKFKLGRKQGWWTGCLKASYGLRGAAFFYLYTIVYFFCFKY